MLTSFFHVSLIVRIKRFLHLQIHEMLADSVDVYRTKRLRPYRACVILKKMQINLIFSHKTYSLFHFKKRKFSKLRIF